MKNKIQKVETVRREVDRPSVCSDADETMETTMARKYFTLLEKNYDGAFTIQFGDYDREVVEQERNDIWDSMIERFWGSKAKTFKIIQTGPGQKEIDEAVRKLNEKIGMAG